MVVDQKDLPASSSDSQAEQIAPLTLNPKGAGGHVVLFSCLYVGLWALVARPSLEELCEFLGWAIGVMLFLGIICRVFVHRGIHTTLSAEGFESHQTKKPSGRHVIPWAKLKLVGLRKPVWKSFLNRGSKPQTIILNFADQPDFEIDLTRLSKLDQQHFFQMISRCVPQTLLTPEVLFMQVQCLMGNTPSIEGFTQMWSEEFDRKFELANHVTLPAGHQCGNGRYIIELTLATRMSSSTYLASDMATGRFVIKELVVPVSADEQTQLKLLEQFDREARILASISHRLIVEVRDHFVENGRSYLVMECAPGENLRHYVRSNGRCGQRLTVSIARQLLEVLVYLHGQQPPILHRDLTPDNIVYYVNTGDLKVVDFGAANIYQSHGTGTLIGKQGYMPPEQFKGKCSPASDIYALGSTMLFLLTGEDPPGMGRMPELGSHVDPELRKLLESCLQFEEADRPCLNILREQLNNLFEKFKEAA